MAGKRLLEGSAWSEGGLEGGGGESRQDTYADALIWGALMTVLHFLPSHPPVPLLALYGGGGQALPCKQGLGLGDRKESLELFARLPPQSFPRLSLIHRNVSALPPPLGFRSVLGIRRGPGLENM